MSVAPSVGPRELGENWRVTVMGVLLRAPQQRERKREDRRGFINSSLEGKGGRRGMEIDARTTR